MADSKVTIYLSGPMTGLPNFNAEEFSKYAAIYRGQGFDVISPAEMDNGDYSGTYAYYLKRDIACLIDDTRPVSRMYLLPNWHKSKGAQLEKHIAEIIGIEMYDAVTGLLWEETPVQEAYRLVHGDRGVDYGSPLDDFSRTAGMVSALLKHKLREDITPAEIAMLMVCVKLSRTMNAPKRDSITDIAGYAETLWMVLEEQRQNAAGLPK